MSTHDAQLATAYLRAKDRVMRSGFAREVAWQASRNVAFVTEREFLREAAWVVLCAGFRESVIRSKFDALSHAFHEWIDAKTIVTRRLRCRERALGIFGSRRKIDGILQICARVDAAGFGHVASQLSTDPIGFIRSLPFMGEVTSLHLAKNLGVPVVKPDRHLVRLAAIAGCGSPHELCDRIASVIDEKIAVVDLVMWRYATLDPNYEKLFGANVGLH